MNKGLADDFIFLENKILAAITARGVESEAAFGALALEVCRFQRRWHAAYGRLCENLGVPADLDDWREIPALPQSVFKQAAVRTFPEADTVKTFHTSGTTGEGFGAHHFASLRLYDAAILHGWDALAVPRLPQIILTRAPSDTPHSSLSHMMGVLGARARDGAQQWCIAADGRLEVEQTRASLRRAEAEGGPVLLLGTALAFLHLFEALDAESFALPRGSAAMETGGYKGSGRTLEKAGLYALFEKHLGLPPESVLNEYGMTELSSQFYTRGLGAPHCGPAWARALVIDPETGREVAPGETGVLRIFDLANLGSALAVQTRDLAVRGENGGFFLLGRDPAALPRGCSRAADESLSVHPA